MASDMTWSEHGSDDGNQIKDMDKRAIKMEAWLWGKRVFEIIFPTIQG